MKRRRFLASTTATVASGLLTGCSGFPVGSSQSTETASKNPDREFDPDHPVIVRNDDDTDRTVRLEVHRDGETVHTMTVEMGPGSERVVFDLERLSPQGIVQYRVAAEVGSNRDARAVRTTACFGDVYVVIEDGTPTVGVEIC